jgi:hypothetical protein
VKNNTCQVSRLEQMPYSLLTAESSRLDSRHGKSNRAASLSVTSVHTLTPSVLTDLNSVPTDFVYMTKEEPSSADVVQWYSACVACVRPCV